MLPLSPVIKTGTVFMAEKYKMSSYKGTVAEEIFRLAFTTDAHGPIVHQATERNDLTPSFLLGSAQEMSITSFKDPEIQPLISETAAWIQSIHLINLGEPFKEGYLPIN
jgi:hypothetical protein